MQNIYWHEKYFINKAHSLCLSNVADSELVGGSIYFQFFNEKVKNAENFTQQRLHETLLGLKASRA